MDYREQYMMIFNGITDLISELLRVRQEAEEKFRRFEQEQAEAKENAPDTKRSTRGSGRGEERVIVRCKGIKILGRDTP
ncbi:MAG: hypothetical protein ACYCX2_12075 [Christensenellales bacterium]